MEREAREIFASLDGRRYGLCSCESGVAGESSGKREMFVLRQDGGRKWVEWNWSRVNESW